MSRSGCVSRFLHEQDRDFCLRIGEQIQLEELRVQQLKRQFAAVDPGEASCGAILMRLQAGKALVEDRRAVLRLGLIGGGMDPQEAADVVGRALEHGASLANDVVAIDVLHAAIFGPGEEVLDDPTGEVEGADVKMTTDAPAQPDGPTSSAPARRQASRRPKRTRSAAGS